MHCRMVWFNVVFSLKFFEPVKLFCTSFLPNSLPALDLGSICLAWYVQGFHSLYNYTTPMTEEQTLFENNNQNFISGGLDLGRL